MLSDVSPQQRQAYLDNNLIDGQSLKILVEAGLNWLRTNQQTVNSLNVFPVPDGDTGTNMVLTMQSAYAEIATSPERNFGKMAHNVAHGALMGARGNSGVILSQIWRGFARSMDNKEALDAVSFSHALTAARDTAYKGVVRPVEGTILTVAKDIAAAAEAHLIHTNDVIKLLEAVVAEADASVKRTPDLLPILKEAGVVDSGGKGLFFILEGMLRFIKGQSLETALAEIQPLSEMKLEDAITAIEPGQDYEIVVDFRPTDGFNLGSFYSGLEEMGTSIQVGEGDGLYRMHIHVPTDRRYDPIDFVMSMGVVTKVAIENLIAQMDDQQKPCGGDGDLTPAKIEPGQIAVIAVSPGKGIARVFISLGAAGVIEGGQTMNPSTQEIIHSFEHLPTDKIILLPNNKNIILAGNTAAELTTKKVAVIPSRSVPQGLAAILRLAPDGDFEDVVHQMTRSINDVQTGEITIATRNVTIDGVQVEEGHVIGLHNGSLVVSTDSMDEACLGLLEQIQASNYELITVFYGSNIAKTDVNRIVDKVRHSYPKLEIEVQEGCQPHYQFIFSIE